MYFKLVTHLAICVLFNAAGKQKRSVTAAVRTNWSTTHTCMASASQKSVNCKQSATDTFQLSGGVVAGNPATNLSTLSTEHSHLFLRLWGWHIALRDTKAIAWVLVCTAAPWCCFHACFEIATACECFDSQGWHYWKCNCLSLGTFYFRPTSVLSYDNLIVSVNEQYHSFFFTATSH